jgi:hypothetical protein
LLVVLPPGTTVLLVGPEPPVSDGLVKPAVGLGGGPIDVLLPPALGRGFDIDIEGFRTFEGVPVLGVDEVDVAADNCLVGDFVGDCLR